MEPNRNIIHKFDLAGAKAGDWFLGCTRCWWQLPFRTAGVARERPGCGNKRLSLLDVTKEDVDVTSPRAERLGLA